MYTCVCMHKYLSVCVCACEYICLWETTYEWSTCVVHAHTCMWMCVSVYMCAVARRQQWMSVLSLFNIFPLDWVSHWSWGYTSGLSHPPVSAPPNSGVIDAHDHAQHFTWILGIHNQRLMPTATPSALISNSHKFWAWRCGHLWKDSLFPTVWCLSAE